MFRTIADFAHRWELESDGTLKALHLLTDASLSRTVTSDHRTLGRLAWHLTGTLREMMERTVAR